MFVSGTGFNCPRTNYNAPPPPPSPRKSSLTSNNWSLDNSPSAMVTPRDTSQTAGEQTSSPHHHRTGSTTSHRSRGSCSAVMLESAIGEMHDGCDQSGLQATNQDMAMDESNGYAQQQQHAAHPLVSAPHHQQQQFGISTCHAQQNPFGQRPAAPNNQHQKTNHTFLSSMDLMMPSSFNRPHNHDANNTSFGMFESSSHHTSHTAAAGDLLSMSRTIDNPSSMSKGYKKRTASYGGESYKNKMNLSSAQFAKQQQQRQHHQQHLQQQHQQQQYFNQAAMLSPPVHTANNMMNQVSGSSFDGAPYQQLSQNNDDPYGHDNKRRCHRSDSFEMMDD